jgi:putative sugar O-methyltransferase
MEQRLLRAFRKSITDYDPIQKSQHWSAFIDVKPELYDAAYLRDFRSNTLSSGLDDRFSPEDQREIFCDLLGECGHEYTFSNLSALNVGNAIEVFRLGDLYVDAGQCFFIHWMHDLERTVFTGHDIRCVCEIGGGYGGFVGKLAARFPGKYVLIDLPEQNLLSAYFLGQHFPDRAFLLADAVEGNRVTQEQIDAHDFIIVPPWYELDGLAVDLFINTRSMMEMNFDVVRRYFDFIQGQVTDGGFFLNVNRYHKATVGHPIRLSDYPYDDRWRVVESKPQWKQPAIRYLLTQRSAEAGDIREHLASLDPICRVQEERDRRRADWATREKGWPARIRHFILDLPFRVLGAIVPASLYTRIWRTVAHRFERNAKGAREQGTLSSLAGWTASD